MGAADRRTDLGGDQREWRDAQGRYIGPVWKRIAVVKRTIRKHRLSLERSIGHTVEPRRGDLERWARKRSVIAELEQVLADLEAGRDVPPSPVTGVRYAALHDELWEDGRHAQP